MSANDDNQQSQFQSKRGLIIAGLLLFLVGGLYWFYTAQSSGGTATVATEPTAATDVQADSAQSLSEQPIEAPILAEEKAPVAEEKAPVAEEKAPLADKKEVVATTKKATPTLARAKRVVAEPVEAAPVAVAKPEKEEVKVVVKEEAKVAVKPNVPVAPVAAPAPPVAVAKPAAEAVVATPTAKPAVVAATPAVTAKPTSTAKTNVPAVAKTEARKGSSAVPGELKPVAQPVATPVTVSAAPIKRKTKNDEDVEVDLE